MKKKILFLLVFVVLSGCSNNSKEVKKQGNNTEQNNKVIDPDNKERPKSLSCCEGDEKIEPKIYDMTGQELISIENDKVEKERYLVVDTRSEEEYLQGHLKYAINMPADNFKNLIGRIRDVEKVIIYGHNKEETRVLAEELLADGFVYVYNAQGVDEFSYNYVIYKNLIGSEFQKIINKKEEAFIDSRDEKDFNKSHVENAINVNHNNLDNIEDKLSRDKSKAIYLYDYTGDRSVIVAEYLQKLGYNNLTISIDGTKETQFKF
ncbi:rhodanese-like domain-containing protein [Gemella sp. GH3]|uniref:rhodanese-like domain-containing protein n=1 Tax=unclassified Gemella TaxID=2624949 RepID=UPI0015CFEDDD|nr:MULTISPECIES: rhodanese-like domain-containing protein [unclassified Gemella]MBF0713663.1 rhodanese-like domain-containing protein [Gemella sp. GH3.1]NYS50615.1 rhodanese-like domain-containing protein [Gemella sp. GH3]